MTHTPTPMQQIYEGAQSTILTVGSLRSKGTSNGGQTAAINLIQFHISRQLDSLKADPGDQKGQTGEDLTTI